MKGGENMIEINDKNNNSLNIPTLNFELDLGTKDSGFDVPENISIEHVVKLDDNRTFFVFSNYTYVLLHRIENEFRTSNIALSNKRLENYKETEDEIIIRIHAI